MDNNLGHAVGALKNGQIDVSLSSLKHATKVSRQNQDAGAAMLLSFPATRNILWDKRPVGTPVILHANHYRNPTLVIEEKTLRLAHRFTQDSDHNTYSCLLFASLLTDTEREGISINIDRFEANTDVGSGELTESGISIPCLVKKNSAKPKTSVEDYAKSMKLICDRCRSKRKIHLEDFISVYTYCSYHENQQNFLFHMDFTMVTSGTKFKLTPINSIPVVPTALSKNLAGPLSVSHLHGEPKSGYLTMDQTRKLLLVLESDPKAPTLPLVGIWVSGVSQVKDPFVWACCLRYIFSADLKERIVTPPEAFVVAVYTPVHSKPEFYECVTVNGQVVMQFDLSAGHEVIQLPKDCLGRSQSPLEMELLAVESGEKKDLFEAAIENNRNLFIDQSNLQSSDRTSTADDIMPRSIPAPHYGKQASMIRPSVPEVSLLLDENEGSFFPRPVPVPTRMTQAPVYPVQVLSKTKTKKKSKVQKQPMQSSSEPVSPLFDNYHPGGPPQKISSVPVSPATPLYRPGVPYPPPQQSYPQGVQFSSPYRGFSPYPGGLQPVPSSVSGYTNPPQHQMSYSTYQYSGFPNMTTSPQMHMYPSHPNGYQQGPSSLPWNVNMYNPNQSPNLPENQHNSLCPNGNPQHSEQFPHGVHGGPNSNIPRTITSMQHYNNPGEKAKPRPHQQTPSNLNHNGHNMTLSSGTGNSDETLLKQGALSPTHQSMPGSVEGSPQHQSGSTDSGLHVSDTVEPDALVNNTIESHSQVPPDVYELLKMQDMQLKMLREQLSQLLAKQGKESVEGTVTTDVSCTVVPPPSLESRASHDMATQSSFSATPVRKSEVVQPEKCTTAVNTSLWYPEPEQVRCDPLAQQAHSFNLTTQDISVQAGNLECEDTTTSVPVKLKSPQLRLKDRQMYEQEGNMTTDTISFGELQLTSIQDRTEESIMSEMVVDMPAYNSVSPEKHSSSGCTDDESNRSPQLGESVSMYERNFADTEENCESVSHSGDNPPVNLLFKNQKQFYQNLMGGVKKFLAKSIDCTNETDLQTSGEHRTAQEIATPPSVRYSGTNALHRSQSEPCDIKQAMERSGHCIDREPVNVEEMTREQLKNLGISLEQLSGQNSHTSSLFLDPVMLPKISYVSLMLDSESETGAEADALAMKYLTDEQLTELAKVRMNASINRRNRDLDALVTASPSGKSNVTFMGSNHMSFASKKYLERYGLAEDKSDAPDAVSASIDKSPEKESSFNVRQFLQKLSEKSLMGDLSMPNASDTTDQIPLSHSPSDSQGESARYELDSFTALQGKHMSTPAGNNIKTAAFDAYTDQTPVRLRPHQEPEPGNLGAKTCQQNSSATAGYKPMHKGRFDGNPNQQNQGRQRKTGEGAGEFTNSPNSVSSKTADNVLDIERLRELPKLL